jgi:16S rRNA processing protein RimM
MKMLRKEDLSRIGFVNKSSGFKGNLSCIIEIARPEKILNRKFLFILLEGLPVPFAIENMELNGSELIVKFEDIDSEQQAKKLSRKEIYADKQRQKKKNDLLSWKDLAGFVVVDENHGEAGLIEDVMEYPMQMIAKCRLNDKEFMFPLNEDIVIDIDEEGKIVYVDLPDGLLDLYME